MQTMRKRQGQLLLTVQEWRFRLSLDEWGNKVSGTICLVHLPSCLTCEMESLQPEVRCLLNLPPNSRPDERRSPSCLDFLLSISQKIRIEDPIKLRASLHTITKYTWLMDENLGWNPAGHFTTFFLISKMKSSNYGACTFLPALKPFSVVLPEGIIYLNNIYRLTSAMPLQTECFKQYNPYVLPLLWWIIIKQ